MINGPHIEVLADGDVDKIVVSTKVGVAGSSILYEFYPNNIAYIGVSDGTFLKYDFNKSKKLSLIQKGSLYDKTIEKGKYYSDLIVFKDKLSWINVADDCFIW